jgi:NAD(P)H dehydrogenase (quinone)
MTEASRLVVTGAAGQLGQRILRYLRRLHSGPIVATTRRPDALTACAGADIEVRAADFDQPESLERAFRGADRVLIISTDAHDVPGRRLRQHENALAAAREAGIRHVVYTSLTACDPGSPMPIAADHWATEQALAASGMRFTVLRNNLYAEILLEFLPRALKTGQLVAAAGEGAVSWVPRDDVARAAAAVLHAPPPGNQTLDITGSAPVSYAQLAEHAAAASGRKLAYVSTSAEAIAQGMARAGMTAHVVALLLGFQLAAARGDLAVCTNAIGELTGKPPQSLEAFLRDHRDLLMKAMA